MILIELSLFLCLAVAGCTGRGQAATQVTGQAHGTASLSIVQTPTPTGSGVNALLKSSSEAASKTGPAPIETPGGPMSCVEQRMRALQQGKLLPRNVCS